MTSHLGGPTGFGPRPERDIRAEAEALRKQNEALHLQNDELRGAMSAYLKSPYRCATIAYTDAKFILIVGNGMMAEVDWPEPSTGIEHEELVPGAAVRVDDESYAIRGVIGAAPFGKVTTVVRILSKWSAETADGHAIIAAPHLKLRIDDRVVVDSFSGVVAMQNLGRESTTYVYTEATGVSWDDIGGLEEPKRLLIEAIEEPIRHAATYRRYGKKGVKGILLYGSPGTGKTLLAKAVATSLAQIHNKPPSESGLIVVKGPDLLNKYVGESEAGVRRLFKTARAHKEAHGVPAVIVLDECDALLGKRGGSKAVEGMERTIVPQFISEMDGLGESAALVILITNRPDTLDGAVVREGRVDRKVYVPRPTKASAADIARIHLRGKPAADDVARTLIDELYSPKHALFRIQRSEGGPAIMHLSDVVSGASVAGAIERATQLAIRRALKGNDLGITAEDAVEAVAQMTIEERDVDHGFEIDEFCEPFVKTVLGWEKAAGPVASGLILPGGR